MNICTIQISQAYDISNMDFQYDTTQLFSIKRYVDMSSDDFDFDKHVEDILLYKGILSCDFSSGIVETYYFEQRNVLHLSTSSNTGTLFYIAYSDDYKTLFGYKRDLALQTNQLVFTEVIEGSGKRSIDSVWSLHHFYSLNKDIAFISYQLPDEQRVYHYALIDAVQQTFIPITLNDRIRNIEWMTGFSSGGTEYLILKIGEHMVHERRYDWEYNRDEAEEIIVMKVEEFVAKVQANVWDWSAYTVLSSKRNEAFVDLTIIDQQLMILVERFDSADSILLTYDVEQRTTDYTVYPRVYNRLYHLHHTLYAAHLSDIYTQLYNLQTGEMIQEIPPPQKVIAIIEEGLLTADVYLGNEDKTIYIYNDQGCKVWVGNHYFADIEHRFILNIDRS